MVLHPDHTLLVYFLLLVVGLVVALTFSEFQGVRLRYRLLGVVAFISIIHGYRVFTRPSMVAAKAVPWAGQSFGMNYEWGNR